VRNEADRSVVMKEVIHERLGATTMPAGVYA